MTKLKAISLAFLCALLISIAQIFQKTAADKFPEILTNWPLFIGILLYAIGWLVLILALKEGEVTVIFPILALSYILVTFYALLIFHEPVNELRWAGVILIFLGVALVGGSKKWRKSGQ